jgi:hypothetical protein
MVTPVYQCDSCKKVFSDKNHAHKHNRLCELQKKMATLEGGNSAQSKMFRYIKNTDSELDSSEILNDLRNRYECLMEFLEVVDHG